MRGGTSEGRSSATAEVPRPQRFRLLWRGKAFLGLGPRHNRSAPQHLRLSREQQYWSVVGSGEDCRCSRGCAVLRSWESRYPLRKSRSRRSEAEGWEQADLIISCLASAVSADVGTVSRFEFGQRRFIIKIWTGTVRSILASRSASPYDTESFGSVQRHPAKKRSRAILDGLGASDGSCPPSSPNPSACIICMCCSCTT